MECTFCKKTYSTIYNLNHHQRTTKSCLLLQNKLEKVEKIKKTFECFTCKKNFTSKFTLTRHVPKCTQQTQHTLHAQLSFEDLMRKQKEEFDAKLKELSEKEEHKDIELEQLKEKLKQTENELHIERKKEHSPQISNTINQNITTINIYQVMTPEHVLDVFQKHYSIDTLLGGQKALARFVNDGFLKESPVYVCGDRSRQKFYILKDGQKKEDPDCTEILGLTSHGLPRVQEVYETALFDLPEKVTEDEVQDNYQQIISMDKQRSEFKAELSKIVSSDTNSSFNTIIQNMKDRSERLGLFERQG
jgi:hypothetical protein